MEYNCSLVPRSPRFMSPKDLYQGVQDFDKVYQPIQSQRPWADSVDCVGYSGHFTLTQSIIRVRISRRKYVGTRFHFVFWIIDHSLIRRLGDPLEEEISDFRVVSGTNSWHQVLETTYDYREKNFVYVSLIPNETSQVRCNVSTSWKPSGSTTGQGESFRMFRFPKVYVLYKFNSDPKRCHCRLVTPSHNK